MVPVKKEILLYNTSSAIGFVKKTNMHTKSKFIAQGLLVQRTGYRWQQKWNCLQLYILRNYLTFKQWLVLVRTKSHENVITQLSRYQKLVAHTEAVRRLHNSKKELSIAYIWANLILRHPRWVWSLHLWEYIYIYKHFLCFLIKHFKWNVNICVLQRYWIINHNTNRHLTYFYIFQNILSH